MAERWSSKFMEYAHCTILFSSSRNTDSLCHNTHFPVKFYLKLKNRDHRQKPKWAVEIPVKENWVVSYPHPNHDCVCFSPYISLSLLSVEVRNREMGLALDAFHTKNIPKKQEECNSCIGGQTLMFVHHKIH